jgi:prepilin-type processing-associated H-X9-DG protein
MRRSKAFTILEVVVVIATMTLLMSILLPALGRAREQGRATVCLNNLRQMVIVANVYTGDNGGRYPLAGFMDFDNLNNQKEWDFFKIFESGQLKQCEGGFLWSGENAQGVQQCPSFKGNSNSQGDPYTGYNYNSSYIGGFIAKIGDALMGEDSSKEVEVIRPAKCAIFGDGEFTLGANKFMRSPSTGKLDEDFGDIYRYAGTQGYRHLKRTNVAYCDGSICGVDELYTETLSKQIIEEYNKNHPVKVGFLSADNSAYALQ